MIPGIVASQQVDAGALYPPGPSAPSVLADDPYYETNTVLLHGNPSAAAIFVDQMANTWTAFGNAQITTTTPRFGTGAILLDGTGDYIEMVRSSVIGTGDFTVEAWVRIDSLATDGEIFAISNSAANVANFDLVFEYKTSGALRGSIQDGGGTAQVDITSAASVLTTGTWHHVAFTAEGSTARLWVDGMQVQSGAIAGGRVNNLTYARIGFLSLEIGGAVTRYFNGRLADVRVNKGTARYTANFTPPAAQFPSVPVPIFSSRFPVSATDFAQGVATDGTHVWYSDSFNLYKYTMAGVLVTSRNVTGDAPLTKNQINGIFPHAGRLYVSAAEFTAGVGTSYIAEYDPDTLAYITHRTLAGDHFSEALALKDGFWWVLFHANMYCKVYDTSWNLVDTLPLTFTVTGSSGGFGSGQGYDGIAWVGDYIYANIHETYDQNLLDVYYWNGAGFGQVVRFPHITSNATQGIAINPAAPTNLLFAERVYTAGNHQVATTVLA